MVRAAAAIAEGLGFNSRAGKLFHICGSAWTVGEDSHSVTTIIELLSSLTLEEHMNMINQKITLMKRMTDSLTDKVYLHHPSQISNHELSLYRINC